MRARRILRKNLRGAWRSLFCTTCLLVPLTAGAAPIAFDFSATVDTIVDPGSVLAGSGLLVGSNFDGFYTVESTTADVEPLAIAGQFEGGMLATVLQLGAVTLVLDPSTAATNRFWVVDDYPYTVNIDGYAPVVIGADGALDGSPLTQGEMQLYLGSSNTSLLSSDAMLPSMPPIALAEWDELAQVVVTGDVGGDAFQITATVTGFPAIPVPEPSTGLSLALGLVILAASRRDRRRR